MSGDDFALARYTSDGEPDPSFSGDGLPTTDFGQANKAAQSVALQAEGGIVAAGRIVAGGSALSPDKDTNEIALARYTGDGELDPSFAGDGRQTIGASRSRAARPRSTRRSGRPAPRGWRSEPTTRSSSPPEPPSGTS